VKLAWFFAAPRESTPRWGRRNCMASSSRMIVCGVLVLAPLALADKPKPEAVSVNASDMKWGPAPPDLPKDAQLAVLHGDPTKKGVFAIRLKMPDGYKIPPHWHSQDEQLTIISGTLVMHMGDTATADSENLDRGAYHYLPSKMHHAAEAKGETVVQINGSGPFDIHYINRADNPNPKTSMR
jgi:mannose-6-phosphate isomerase-like protein (cupin superfamily)